MNKLLISIILLTAIATPVRADPPEWWTPEMSKALETPWSSTQIKPVSPLAESIRFNNYVVNIYRCDILDTPASFEILRDGEFIYGGHEHLVWILDDQQIQPRADITGDGNPNLIIGHRADAVHPGNAYTLFELGPEFRKIQTLEEVDVFTNLDADVAIEIIVHDKSFEYFQTSYAESVRPTVYLKYRDGAYGFSEELMRKPPLSKKALQTKAAWIRDELEWFDPNSMDGPAPIELWHEAVDLAFHGNLEQVRILIDLCWPNDIEGKNDALADFLNQLQLSIYWDDILKLSGI